MWSALTYYRPLAGVDRCQMRLHATTHPTQWRQLRDWLTRAWPHVD